MNVNGYEIKAFANLYGANLYGANLYRANLREANLREANLRGANLYRANLYRADLYRANLYRADLYRADLCGADLSGADLREANLSGADMRGADLSEADLYGADLREANLRGANLYRANLYRADLYGASLYGANLYEAEHDDATKWPHFQIPQEGELIVWKKLAGDVIARLKVMSKTPRTASLVGRKCRAREVRVLELFNGTRGVSINDYRTEYVVGRIVKADSYDPNPLVECTNGIHFFLTRKEAEEYQW